METSTNTLPTNHLELSAIQFKLTTIMPVSIGDGDLLSPYSDCILEKEGDKVYAIYLDNKAIEKALAQHPEKIDTYVNGIYKTMNDSRTRSDFSLKHFITSDLKLTISQVTKAKYRAFGMSATEKQPIYTIIKNGTQPYISGSTLKGAMKGAILYYWLCKTPTGQQYITNIIRYITSNWKNLEAVEKEIDTLKSKKLSFEERRVIKDKQNQLLFIMDSSIEALFGSFSNIEKDFALFRVTDTNVIDATNMSIYQTKRLHLRTGDLQIPVNREAIGQNKELDFTLTIEKNKAREIRHNDLKFLQDLKNQLPLFYEVLNLYSIDNLRYDIIHFEKFATMAEDDGKALTQDHQKYIDFCKEFCQEVRAAQQQRAYIRIGNGKNYFHNSIGLAIYRENETAFHIFRKVAQLGKENQSEFPITRVVRTNNALPMGWVRFEKA